MARVCVLVQVVCEHSIMAAPEATDGAQVEAGVVYLQRARRLLTVRNPQVETNLTTQNPTKRST